MAILKIARMGHPVLTQVCLPVPDPGAPEIRRLVADMLETMNDAPGVGLAAPQVHVPLRLFVFRVPQTRAGEAPGDTILGESVLINLGPAYSLPEPPTLAVLNHVIVYLPEFDLYDDPTANIAAFGMDPPRVTDVVP